MILCTFITVKKIECWIASYYTKTEEISSNAVYLGYKWDDKENTKKHSGQSCIKRICADIHSFIQYIIQIQIH